MPLSIQNIKVKQAESQVNTASLCFLSAVRVGGMKRLHELINGLGNKRCVISILVLAAIRFFFFDFILLST
jgi:hypothetical protein